MLANGVVIVNLSYYLNTLKNTLFILFVFFGLHSFGQEGSSDDQLAGQYFQNGEFAKAADLYEKLYSKTASPYYYQYYLMCLIEGKEYKQAEKLIKKQIKRDNRNLQHLVDLGNLYKKMGEQEKGDKEYSKAINLLEQDNQQILDLANAFITKKELDKAIETYQKGRRLMRGMYPFNMELAEVYSQKGDFSAMIREYIDILESGDSYLYQIKNILQVNVTDNPDDKKNQLLKAELLKRVQANPDKLAYVDLLVWLFTQEKNFDAAFNQLKAIDKRKKEDGNRLMSLAPIAIANQDYDVAVKCYEYVISKGKETYYYINARIELVNVLNIKITNNTYNDQDLIQIEQTYINALNELGRNNTTVPLIKGLAHLYAFYLNNATKAIDLLNEAISLSNNNQRLQAECKVELADVMVFTGEVWESALLYGQVEKAFKEDVLGQEAKYKNAKLSYYRGEFAWAQAQLDVLKASTSKLIANDALYLSLLIMDNSGLDSITTPLLMFSRAELFEYQHQYENAVKTLDSINIEFPGHALADDILYRKANICLSKKQYIESADLLKQITEKFSYDILADDALYKLANLYENQLNDKTKAMELYQDILFKFPGSLYVVEARKHYRKLRGDKLN